jgi:hypothetical protein
MSSTADGFSVRSLTVFCGRGSLRKCRGLNTKVYVTVHVCKLQSEICVLIAMLEQQEWAVSVLKVQKGSECFHAEAGGSSFRWKPGLSAQLDNVTFKNTVIFLYVYPETFTNTYVLKQNSVKKILVTVPKVFWTNVSFIAILTFWRRGW